MVGSEPIVYDHRQVAQLKKTNFTPKPAGAAGDPPTEVQTAAANEARRLEEHLWKLQADVSRAQEEVLRLARLVRESTGTFWNSSGHDDYVRQLYYARAKLDRLNSQLTAMTGQVSHFRTVAGDEALDWSYARKFYEAFKYAVEHGQFTGELLNQMTELVDLLSDPAAMAQFVAMIGGMAALKKLACKVGVSGTAGALLTAKDAAETGLKLYEIKQELDAITYKAEVANAAPHIAKVMAELVASISFSALLRRIKCFAAGTQIAVAMSRNDDGSWKYETKSIEDIRGVEEAGEKADWVLAREELGERIELRRVLRTVCHSSDHLRVLEFADATGERQTIRTTDEHPFWVVNSQRYVPAEHLEVGQSFTSPNGERQTLVAARRESYSNGVLVYNFEVEAFHTYFVQSGKSHTPLLTHNNNCTSGSIRGKTPNKVAHNILEDNPTWKRKPADGEHGWKIVDENGVERMRYMYPNKNGKFDHERKGYFVRKDAEGRFLDVDGNIIPDGTCLPTALLSA